MCSLNLSPHYSVLGELSLEGLLGILSLVHVGNALSKVEVGVLLGVDSLNLDESSLVENSSKTPLVRHKDSSAEKSLHLGSGGAHLGYGSTRLGRHCYGYSSDRGTTKVTTHTLHGHH